MFLRPMSVSPFLSSMSEFRSFRIPAQSILQRGRSVRSLNVSLIKAFTHAERIRMGCGPIIQTTELTNVTKMSTEIFIDPKLSGFCEFYGSFWTKVMEPMHVLAVCHD